MYGVSVILLLNLLESHYLNITDLGIVQDTEVIVRKKIHKLFIDYTVFKRQFLRLDKI